MRATSGALSRANFATYFGGPPCCNFSVLLLFAAVVCVVVDIVASSRSIVYEARTNVEGVI